MLQRRTFLKALAAATWTPLIELRPELDREKLMLAFCDPDDVKYDLSQPFAAGSLTYATDRYAIIRGEITNRMEIGERKTPRVEPVWNDHWHPTGNWISLDAETAKPTITLDCGLCPHCGDARVTCGPDYPNWNDKELVAKLMRYDFDVDNNTIRDASCPLCHGLDYKGPSVTNLLGTEHNAYFLKRIVDIPNVTVCQTASRHDAILFRGDGFQGISLGIDDR